MRICPWSCRILLEPKFLHQMLGIADPSMHLDRHILWVSMMQEVYGTQLQHCRRVDGPRHECISISGFQVQGRCEVSLAAHVSCEYRQSLLAHHIINLRANWQASAFTQVINSISIKALEANWDCMKVLAYGKKFSDHFHP